MHTLIVSPIASHPQNQGNSARITAVGRQLQALGHVVHFLYYPLEGLTSQQREDMSRCWDYFHTMPCDLPNTGKTLGNFYAVDDWYDPRLGDYAAALHERWHYGMVLVNYVWFSSMLDSLPDTLLKVIDTHDVFGDRHLRFTEMGLEPEWFYTTPKEERRGLERSDLVVAIQNEEEAYFRKLLNRAPTRVTTIGFVTPQRFVAARAMPEKPVVGYLGSGNPFNVNSIRQFVEAVLAVPEVCEAYRFVIAGTICDKLTKLPLPFERMGRVDDIGDFYANTDFVINPMIGGTGLKIKTLEALSFGLPVLATESAMTGIKPHHAFHSLSGMAELVSALRELAKSSVSPNMLREASKNCFLDYTGSQIAQFQDVFAQ